MNYQDLNFISRNLSGVIHDLSLVMDYVEKKDLRLYADLSTTWNRLLNVKNSALRRLNSRPVCPDRSNCPGWIGGYGCDDCDYKPFDVNYDLS